MIDSSVDSSIFPEIASHVRRFSKALAQLLMVIETFKNKNHPHPLANTLFLKAFLSKHKKTKLATANLINQLQLKFHYNE